MRGGVAGDDGGGVAGDGCGGDDGCGVAGDGFGGVPLSLVSSSTIVDHTSLRSTAALFHTCTRIAA